MMALLKVRVRTAKATSGTPTIRNSATFDVFGCQPVDRGTPFRATVSG
jgi:hypothetical protein